MPPHSKEVFVLRVWRLLPPATAFSATFGVAILVVSAFVASTFLALPAGAQGNIDAGRTPAQLFADTCAACHRNSRDVKRATAGFLRQHYTAGSDEAAAMANYLSGVSNDQRGAQPKRPPATVGEPGAENPKQQPKQAPKQPPQQAAIVEQAKSAQQGQAKGQPRRPAAAPEIRPAVAAAIEERPQPEAAPALTLSSPMLLQSSATSQTSSQSPLVLEPFEE
jgi:hypothetical protein